MARRSKKSGHKRSGFLFMILILLVLGLVLFIYKENFNVLIDTGLYKGKNIFSQNNESNQADPINPLQKFIKSFEKEQQAAEPQEEEKNNSDSPPEQNDKKVVVLNQQEEHKPVPTQQKPKIQEPETKNSADTKTSPPPQKQQIPTQSPKEKTAQQRISKKIYFSKLDQNDHIQLVESYRSVSKEIPLTESIQQLLQGPNSNEENHQFLTNIPNGTQLLSISIKNKIAYLNFSHDFEKNHYGKESTINQLKQIVYTATEYNNINAVQFLIDGKIKTYLGGEGVFIDKPLSRKDFS
ncbi:MAG: GerMN domain-containing protein [Spirochaetes bacterium]|nr:GerMN domain-containing protein [Spirochaetota bacterium]